jgi:hypothetical protein
MLKDIAAESSCLTYKIQVRANSVKVFIIVIRNLLLTTNIVRT